MHEVRARHRHQQIEIALDQRVLGDDRARMAVLGEHLEDRARDAVAALDRLVRIRVRAEIDRRADIARFAELLAQKLGRIRLREQLRLEIDACREIQIPVRRPRVAVDAAVLAAAVRIDRLLEMDVRRIVAADDRARALLGHDGIRPRRRLVLAIPAVVLARARDRLEAAFAIRRRAAALDARRRIDAVQGGGLFGTAFHCRAIMRRSRLTGCEAQRNDVCAVAPSPLLRPKACRACRDRAAPCSACRSRSRARAR